MNTETGVSVGIVEFRMIPKGLSVLNEIIKKVTLVGMTQEYISGGRLIGYLFGTYESVNYALESIIDMCDEAIIDIGILGNPHEQFLSFISHELKVVSDQIENIFVFEMSEYGTCLEMVNLILHHTDVDLIGINKKDYLDGVTLAAFGGSIGSLKIAKEIVPTGEMITNIESVLVKDIISWRS